MSQNKWDEINPKYVSSLCFQKHKKAYLSIDENNTDPKRKVCKDKFKLHIEKAI
jgi:hypothetical protein